MGKGQGKGTRLPNFSQGTAHHDHEDFHDQWWPPRVVVPLVVEVASHCLKAHERNYDSWQAPRLVEPFVRLPWACELKAQVPSHCLKSMDGTTARGAPCGP
uniref:Uncharacterized protein n=1 Tax=Solanum tuberosum TaxID=4113 RepID=M1DG27_SOLTU